MADGPGGWTDERVEAVLGNLLRAGVLLSAVVVSVGGGIYLAHHGRDRVAHYHTFDGEPPELTNPRLIVRSALHHSGRGLIQFGLLLLIATPVARVVFSVFAFLRERDWTYVALTSFVLLVLLFSLFHGYE
jgi:uncharacterized membrane protein